MLLHDRATIEGKARITREGYLVADAYVAMANNIQEYHAAELGLTDRAATDVVRVFRPEREVFAIDSLQSASRLPITLKHPAADVNATNWRDLAKGETGEEMMRDGDRLRVPLRVTDAGAVNAVRTDHSEFSLGYTAELKIEAGVHDGKPYDATLSGISYNHLAAVPKARGGSSLRIVDERTIPENGDVTMKIKIGDAEVDLSDGAAVALAVGTLNATLTDALGKVGTLTADLATAQTTIQAKDGEIAALNQKVTDAEVTPAKLQQLADARAEVIGKAKALMPSLVTDGKTDAEIRKEAVVAKLGDAAKDMADAAIEGAFVAFTKDAKVDPIRDAFKGGIVTVGDAHSRMTDAWKSEDHNAWRKTA